MAARRVGDAALAASDWIVHGVVSGSRGRASVKARANASPIDGRTRGSLTAATPARPYRESPQPGSASVKIGDEHPSHRLGRPRACAGLEARRVAAADASSMPRPAIPASPSMPKCVALDIADHAAVIAFCREQAIDLVVVGPEAPLVAGIADDLAAAGIRCSARRRRRPSSKARRASPRICAPTTTSRPPPTAASPIRRRPRPMSAQQGAPIVVKADGLAAGKGVTVAMTLRRGASRDRRCFAGAFGGAGAEVVDRGIPRRRGGELLLPVRRHDRAAARHGAGPQARRRRRQRTQHRRHGRLFAGPGHDADDDRAHDGARSSSRRCAAWRSAARRSRACCSPG